jgi:hypothetical protein
MKNKKGKSRENENLETTPSFSNFNEYFEEFHKMFNHCKYNLVALNKKFDALEMFFKNYILVDRNPGDVAISRDYETPNKTSTRIKNGSRRNYSNLNRDESNLEIKTEKEENFPISIEDLDYLTKNYITEETNGNVEERIMTNYKNLSKNSQSSTRKKKNLTEITNTKNKDVKLDESLVEFFGKNNIGEEEFTELPVQIDKNTENNFVQKLFDYKTFSQSLKKNEYLKEEALLNNNNNENIKENDNSKWISKNEVDLKSPATNDENIKFLSADLTLSLAENIESGSSHPINKFDNKLEKEESKSQPITKYSEFSNFMRANKMSLKKKFVPNKTINNSDIEKKENSVINDSDSKEDNLINNESKQNKYLFQVDYGIEMRTVDQKSEEFYNLRTDRETNFRLLKKKQNRTKYDCGCKKVGI